MGLINLGRVKGETGDTGEQGVKGDTGSRGTGIKRIEEISEGIRFCLTDGRNFDIALHPGPAPSYTGVTLTGDKSILSYYDSDSATLTAQLLDDGSPVSVSGVSVGLYKDNVLWDTLVTDANGRVSKTYASTGTGDHSFEARVGSLVSEIYTLEDCFMYRNSLSQTTGLSIQLPSDFEMSFNLKRTNGTTNNYGLGYILLNDGSRTYYVGEWGSLGQNGLLIRNNGSSSNIVNERCTDIANNTPTNIYYEYDNGLHTYMKDNETKTYNNSTYHPTEIREFGVGTMMSFTNLKIKAL